MQVTVFINSVCGPEYSTAFTGPELPFQVSAQPHAHPTHPCRGPQVLDDTLYSHHHVSPHCLLLWTWRHEIEEVHDLFMQTAHETWGNETCWDQHTEEGRQGEHCT